MSRYTGPKCRLCRREGVSLCGKEKCALKRHNYIPGQHGPKGSFAKKSEYARQLREKQKLKRLFGVTERQMGNYFKKATAQKDITGDALMKLLETRFDNVVYRAGMAKTRAQARQMVNHGLFKVKKLFQCHVQKVCASTGRVKYLNIGYLLGKAGQYRA